MGWYLEALVNFANFSGRASRSEYLWFNIFNIAIIIALAKLTAAGRLPDLVPIAYVAAMLLPSVTVSIRRLHDTNRTGWWLLLSLVPFGSLVLLIFYLIPGTDGPNSYGPEFRTSSQSTQRHDSQLAKAEQELMRLYQLQKTGAMSLEEYQERRRAILARL